MKKPVEAIERMRMWVSGSVEHFFTSNGKAILAYLGSRKPWPADLTRERLEDIARNGGWNKCTDIILRLAELAPVREKRMVEIWENPANKNLSMWENDSPPNGWIAAGWRKVGGPFEIEG